MPLTRSLKTQKRLPMPSWIGRALGSWGLVGLLTLVGLFLGGPAGTAIAQGTKGTAQPEIAFEMVVSAGAAPCLPNASGIVRITSQGPVEQMDVEVVGLPPNTDFDFFVIQLPKSPFGLSWDQGDIETDAAGFGQQRFIGRFSIETFIVAPGSGPAPVVFDQPPFPDADSNP